MIATVTGGITCAMPVPITKATSTRTQIGVVASSGR